MSKQNEIRTGKPKVNCYIHDKFVSSNGGHIPDVHLHKMLNEQNLT